MKPTFITYSRPLLTSMIQSKTPSDAIAHIVNALNDGAEAFGIQLEDLAREYRTEKTLTEIFRYCKNKPIYITSYRHSQSTGMTDDECVELLLLGLKCGATLCDVMGDLYHPEPHELTFDEKAVEKQKKLIDTIHEMGGEVLISSHLHTFFESEKIVEYAKEQVSRGADIVKIVSFVQTEDELMQNLMIANRLKHEIDKPYLFLASGAYSRLLRMIGPNLGVCMYLCVQNHGPMSTKEQPKLSATKAVRDGINL